MGVSHATVKHAVIRFHSPDLVTTVQRGIGFRGTCRCGWQGPKRTARNVALEDARIHGATCTA
jgi:hypothetical protein